MARKRGEAHEEVAVSGRVKIEKAADSMIRTRKPGLGAGAKMAEPLIFGIALLGRAFDYCDHGREL